MHRSLPNSRISATAHRERPALLVNADIAGQQFCPAQLQPLPWGDICMIERRHEPRTLVDVELLIWGVDARGECFLREVRGRDVSLRGALLSGVDTEVRPGDLIGILYAGKSARFRVVWIRYDGTGDKMQAAVRRVEADPCPWLDLLAGEELLGQPPLPQPKSEAHQSAFSTQHSANQSPG
jgi:hypothetical protein